ncbi:MAG TPA: glycosyltransferase [Gammaproteobacteria bacterium]|nr:glycosyltransferase [Gammaproteobacteria bacterium]
MNIVILGLSITSSWGNGHATTYRGLVRELANQGHEVLFLERDQPWYAAARDLPNPPFGKTQLYDSLAELDRDHAEAVRTADAVIVGSYVPEGIAVGRWVLDAARGLVAFYDIDTPVTLAALEAGKCVYLDAELVPRYDLYLSFTGGPILERLQSEFGARRTRPLYCAVDPDTYFPEPEPQRWATGYLGTYSADRQPHLQSLLLEAARQRPDSRFVVAGAQYPSQIEWPENVEHIEHIAPAGHRGFYNAQRYTLNLTRAAMTAAGYSPSVRLFEAAACGVPVISDWWNGLDTFFAPGREILIADDTVQVLHYLDQLDAEQAKTIGHRARTRVLSEHTAAHRARELTACLESIHRRRATRRFA